MLIDDSDYYIQDEQKASGVLDSFIRIGYNKRQGSNQFEKIEKQAGYRTNTLVIEQPHFNLLEEDVKIIKLKEVRNRDRSRKPSESGSSIIFEEQSIIQRQTSHEFLYQEPEMPPKVIGRVRRCYKLFACMSSNRTMVLNFEAIRFYFNQEDLENSQRVIQLENVKQVQSYRKQTSYFLRITTTDEERIDLRFASKEVCKQWIEYFNKAMDYHDYLSEKMNYYRSDSKKNLLKTLEEKDKTKIIKLQDSTMVPESQKQVKAECNTIIKSGIKNTTRLANFKVTQEIGRGAFSTVYKAQRQGKIYALKQINKDKLLYQNQIKYALTQLNILKRCTNKCPFVIPLYYAFQTEDYLYLAIKYLPFGTLKDVVQKRRKLTMRQAFNIICELIVVIEFLHKNKILYRDMKPQNILMTKEGHIYLIDYGLSIELNQYQQFAQSFVGTPLYLAPQRLDGSGKINYKADIYGVGCIFYLMLHGHAPFQAQNLASILYNIKNSQLHIREDIDDLAQDFIRKTLQTNVEKRLNHMSSHPLFQKVDWNKINRKQTQIMNLQSKQSSNKSVTTGPNDKDYTQENYPNKKINDWNYADPNLP